MGKATQRQVNLETFQLLAWTFFGIETNSDKFPFFFHFLLGILLLINTKTSILNFANAITLTDCQSTDYFWAYF